MFKLMKLAYINKNFHYLLFYLLFNKYIKKNYGVYFIGKILNFKFKEKGSSPLTLDILIKIEKNNGIY